MKAILIIMLFVQIFSIEEDFVKNGKIISELTTDEYLQIIKPFLPENPMILEAGCCDGSDTVKLAKMWPLGQVYAFEPLPNFINLANNAIQSNNISNACIFPFALDSTSGNKTFYFSTIIGGASSLLQSNEEMKDKCNYKDIEIKVNCINLDEWTQKNKINSIDFMWLDMEGNEYYVLNSSPNILKTIKVIITEINFCEFRKGMTQFKDLNKLLISNGFKLHKIWGSPFWQGTALYIK